MPSVTSRFAALAPPDTRVGYLLRLSRPRFWLYLAGPAFVGAVYAAETSAEIILPAALAVYAYFLVPANVFLYGVNDVFDADVDELNPKKDEREVRFRGGNGVLAAVVASGLLGVALAAALPIRAAAATLAFLALATEYSAPPLRFKTTPFLDSLSNGLYLLPGVVAYVTVAGSLPPTPALVGAWLWTMGMHTFSAIPDVDPDRTAGIQTTATVLGEQRTYVYCAVVWTLAAVGFGLVHSALGALLAVYPVFLTGVVLSDVSVDRAYWWFPFLNTAVGTLLAMGGIWRLLYGV